MIFHTFHNSLNRPNLFLGGDRRIVMGVGMIAVGMIFILQTWLTLLTGCALWTGVVFVSRMMAKADPLMREVFSSQLKSYTYTDPLTHIRLSGYIPAKTSVFYTGRGIDWSVRKFKWS